jgi:hypothetical protein
MPLYMDIHNLREGTTAEDVAKAHAKDMETQQKYGVEYTKYWVNEKAGKVFCLAHAPSAEAAEQVHREAHGLMPDKIIEVQPELAEGFLGGVETNAAGAVIFPGGGADARDPAIRTILFTDIVNSTTCEMGCPRSADARSSTLAMGSWHRLFRQRARFAAPFRFSANWTSTRKRTPRAHSRFESAPRRRTCRTK